MSAETTGLGDGALLDFVVAYSGKVGSVRWEGRSVDPPEQFRQYLRDVVRPRLADEESSFEAELLGLATTGVKTRFVERVLQAVPEPEAWEIGEAFAECVLRDDPGREVHWPWNTVRDRRTPRASLPGADLVGFCRDGADVFLLIGEVKTSSDTDTPPSVMRGVGGMVGHNSNRLPGKLTSRVRCCNGFMRGVVRRSIPVCSGRRLNVTRHRVEER